MTKRPSSKARPASATGPRAGHGGREDLRAAMAARLARGNTVILRLSLAVIDCHSLGSYVLIL